MSKAPVGWPIMAQAYIDFAIWAIGQPGFIEAFTADTGIKFTLPKNSMERLIDDATGANKAIIAAYLDWLTVSHWGEA